MRNLVRFVAVFCGLAVAGTGATLLAGCGGSGGGGTNNPVVGRWRATSIASGGQSINCPGALSVNGAEVASCGPNDTIEFRDNGTLSGSGEFGGLRAEFSGAWTQNGDTITGTTTQIKLDLNDDGIFQRSEISDSPNEDDDLGTATVSFSGNTMTLTVVDETDGTVSSTTVTRL